MMQIAVMIVMSVPKRPRKATLAIEVVIVTTVGDVFVSLYAFSGERDAMAALKRVNSITWMMVLSKESTAALENVMGIGVV